ncbi:MAG: hypothetical protein A3K13_03070 [Gemmatimonadetes bacterium RIFCSPLOWO2_12_FULL_68_9]|nr:MAG: hypothetical protein A3K13_03070 [Gemmatimonadetes bacterium RIFCSPLOWO2_12_FULL_68_9]
MERLQAALEGRYQVRRLLGRGGMGAVFLATDVALDRQVAIKLLPPDMAHDENFVRRFEQEARTAAKLDHPNIMPIYAVEGIDDLHFFVMKYVAGRSLDQVLEAGAVPTDVAQQILWEAACALGHAHQRGFVHRDIKPANILLDDDGHVMLTDFGISKALQSASQFTATGQVIGTPHYLSPEQARGGELDGRSDQYSLGIVAYRALTGGLPFDDDSVHTLLYKHIYEMPPPVEQVRPEVPAFLATAVRRALNKDPNDRFPTMEDFATAVWPEHPVTAARKARRASRPASTASSAPTQITPAPQPGAKRRRWLAAALGVLVLAGGGAAAGLVLKRSGTEGAGRTGGDVANPVGQQPGAVVSAPETTTARTAGSPQPGTAAPAPTQVQRRSPPTQERTPAQRPVQEAAPAPAIVGYLTVDATPFFGAVYIDRVEVGDTPVIRHALTPGRHVIEVRREGFRTTVDTVVITGANTTVLRKVLIREP